MATLWTRDGSIVGSYTYHIHTQKETPNKYLLNVVFTEFHFTLHLLLSQIACDVQFSYTKDGALKNCVACFVNLIYAYCIYKK